MLQQLRTPKALRAWGVAADDFGYASMRKPPYPMCATRPPSEKNKKKATQTRWLFLGKAKGSELKSHHLLLLLTQTFNAQSHHIATLQKHRR